MKHKNYPKTNKHYFTKKHTKRCDVSDIRGSQELVQGIVIVCSYSKNPKLCSGPRPRLVRLLRGSRVSLEFVQLFLKPLECTCDPLSHLFVRSSCKVRAVRECCPSIRTRTVTPQMHLRSAQSLHSHENGNPSNALAIRSISAGHLFVRSSCKCTYFGPLFFYLTRRH